MDVIRTTRRATGGRSWTAGVGAYPPTVAWALGSAGVRGTARGVIEHWDGSSWTVQTSARVPGAQLRLSAVSATSATDAWAVGIFTASGSKVGQTFIEHWD